MTDSTEVTVPATAAVIVLRDSLFERKPEAVPFKPLGEGYFLRPMTGSEQDTWRLYCKGAEVGKTPCTSCGQTGTQNGKPCDMCNGLKQLPEFDMKGMRAYMVVASVCDENGALLFTQDDTDRINDLDAVLLTNIFSEAQAINGMTTNAVENLEKNLESESNTELGSDSPKS